MSWTNKKSEEMTHADRIVDVIYWRKIEAENKVRIAQQKLELETKALEEASAAYQAAVSLLNKLQKT